MLSKRQLTAIVGFVCLLPIAVIFTLIVAVDPWILLQLTAPLGLTGVLIIGYTIEFLGTAGFVLLLVAWLAKWPPAVPPSPNAMTPRPR